MLVSLQILERQRVFSERIHFRFYYGRGASETTTNSCKPGSLISVKGRLEINDEKFILIAEHLEFLYPK